MKFFLQCNSQVGNSAGLYINPKESRKANKSLFITYSGNGPVNSTVEVPPQGPPQ